MSQHDYIYTIDCERYERVKVWFTYQIKVADIKSVVKIVTHSGISGSGNGR